MRPTSRLTLDFAERMVQDLATNNVLRGSWAEQLVAHFLGIEKKLPPNWSYYDMRDGEGRDVSVKHSVGPSPKFSVAMNGWAWDAGLRDSDPSTEGWYGGPDSDFQYWCHAYVFAWLEHPNAAPELDLVLDSERWRFAALSRAEMYQMFVRPGKPAQKSVGLSTLGADRFVSGAQLARVINGFTNAEVVGVPPRRMVPWHGVAGGVPVEAGSNELVPESLAPD